MSRILIVLLILTGLRSSGRSPNALALRLLILHPEATNPNQSEDNLSPLLPAAVLHVQRSFPRQSVGNTSLHPSAPFHLSVSISCVLMRPGTGGGDLTFKSQASPLQWSEEK